jgi:hypothetical protein
MISLLRWYRLLSHQQVPSAETSLAHDTMLANLRAFSGRSWGELFVCWLEKEECALDGDQFGRYPLGSDFRHKL